MKKTSKVLGAIALSASLALGCAAPAFADTDGSVTKAVISDEQQKTLNKGAGAETDIDISTYTSQLKATLPLKVAVAADTMGGTGMSPTNYYIENNSRNSIYVSKIEVQPGENTGIVGSVSGVKDWLIPSKGQSETYVGNGTNIIAAPSATAAKYGYVDVTLKPAQTSAGSGSTSISNSTAYKLSDGTVDTTKESPDTLNDWTIPTAFSGSGTAYETKGSGGKLTFTVTTLSSMLNQELQSEQDLELAKIVYTISAGVGPKSASA